MFEYLQPKPPSPDDPWLIRHRVLGGIVSVSAVLFFVWRLLRM
jgi:hypothetical protein